MDDRLSSILPSIQNIQKPPENQGKDQQSSTKNNNDDKQGIQKSFSEGQPERIPTN